MQGCGAGNEPLDNVKGRLNRALLLAAANALAHDLGDPGQQTRK